MKKSVFRIAGASLALVGATIHSPVFAAPVTNSPVANSSDNQSLPPVKLRGYGTLSANFRALSNGASVLRITAQDEAHAKLIHAKFLSDLGSFPGVSTAQNGLRAVAGQGVMAALRDGTKVLILSAPTIAALEQLIQTQSGKRALPRNAEVAVPMYLDRWDKFGFRFYYREWSAPQGVDWKNYDNAQDFRFAREQDRSGMVFWDQSQQVDSAQGMMNEVWWEWAARLASQNQLPIAINTNIGSGATPSWLINRHRAEEQQKMPQYLGSFYRPGSQEFGGQGTLSWNAGRAQDEELALLQASIRRFAQNPNVVSFLEPHGELEHGPHDVFLEYGPVADRTYRIYLQEKYKTLAALGTRWFGDAARFKKWNEVRVPEIAEFEGWGPNALDLTGPWRIGYEPFADGRERSPGEIQNYDNTKVDTKPAPAEWFAPDFNDSAWPQGTAPGDDRAYLWTKRPAVLRRRFDVPAAWRAANPRVWIYVWDLNRGSTDTVRAVVNGREVGKDTLGWNRPHWNAYEVTDALRDGENLLALRLPKGFLGYRCYLSGQEPTQYPNFGEGKNAQWVDFSDWRAWSRLDAARRGMEMIRQVDANRPLTLMAPSNYANSIKNLAEGYGGEFHNTGFMGAFYADIEPLLMQSSNLPFSLEPGGPAPDLASYKKMMGLYFSAGTQSVDYFIHVGDVLWKPDIKAEFERTRPMLGAIGKYHAPKADVAVLYGERVQTLTAYPWGNDPNVNLGSGYWQWNVAANLRDRYTRDGLTEGDFGRGHAQRYRVIIDTNTSIMDEEMVSDIERYVRGGGTFVTYVQTGRHTPTRKDSWPIERLTGFRVTAVSRHDQRGEVPQTERRALRPAPGQEIYRAGDFDGARANGLTLQAVASDSKPLLLWEDGSVAVGARPLGKGWIIEVGAKFFNSSTFDRIEAGGNNADVQRTTRLFHRLLEWRGIAPTPARLTTGGAPDGPVILRHWESNNGLYNVWTLWNQSSNTPVTTDLQLDAGVAASSAIDVVTGGSLPLEKDGSGTKLGGITLAPLETRVFLTPRLQLQNAALNWLQLQRNWWRGTKTGGAKPLPMPNQDYARDLTDGWTWGPATSDEDAALAKTVASATTPTVRFGAWNAAERGGSRHGVFSRTFTVPAKWTSGRVKLWVQSWSGETFVGQGRIFLDGQLIKDWNAEGLAGYESPSLRAGSTHTLLIEAKNGDAKNAAAMVGSRGAPWLSWVPAPQRSIDLAGQWEPSPNALTYNAPVTFPGPWNGITARRTIEVPDADAKKTVVLNMETEGNIVGVFVNGHWVRRHHHMIGRNWQINVSPWIRAGQNTIELGAWENPAQGRIHAASLDIYALGDFF